MKGVLSFSLICTSLTFASVNERIEDLEWQMQDIKLVSPIGTRGANFAPATPNIKDENWFLTFDLLYWHPKVGNTEFAYSFQPAINNGNGFFVRNIKGATRSNHFHSNFGLRGGIGYHFPNDHWNFFAEYTWFQSHSTRTSAQISPSALMPLKIFGNLLASKAKSFYPISYQNLDVSLKYSYFLSHLNAFDILIAVKSAWIDLNQNITYTASPLNDVAFPGLQHTNGLDFKTKSSNYVWGLGPQIGANSIWHLWQGFYLFGDGALALLQGYYKTAYSQKPPPGVSDALIGQSIKNRAKFHRVFPFTKLYLGLGWQNSINQDRQYLSLKLGYEVQYFWRVNQMLEPEDFAGSRLNFSMTSEDVMFYGLTGHFRIDY